MASLCLLSCHFYGTLPSRILCRISLAACCAGGGRGRQACGLLDSGEQHHRVQRQSLLRRLRLGQVEDRSLAWGSARAGIVRSEQGHGWLVQEDKIVVKYGRNRQ